MLEVQNMVVVHVISSEGWPRRANFMLRHPFADTNSHSRPPNFAVHNTTAIAMMLDRNNNKALSMEETRP